MDYTLFNLNDKPKGKTMIEVNYSGQENTFGTLEEAINFSDNLSVGSDIWVDGNLYRTRISDCLAGGFVVEVM